MAKGTLVWSSRDWTRDEILSSSDNVSNPANKLMNSIFNYRSDRLVITRNKYFYNPSDEYKERLVRYRGIRK